jgi:hypothetical protein
MLEHPLEIVKPSNNHLVDPISIGNYDSCSWTKLGPSFCYILNGSSPKYKNYYRPTNTKIGSMDSYGLNSDCTTLWAGPNIFQYKKEC